MLKPRLVEFGRTGHEEDRLVWSDCLPLQEQLPDSCVQTIYMDPPFGTGKERKGDQGQRYDDFLQDPEKLASWLQPRLEHSKRVLNHQGSLFLHVDYRTVHYLKVLLDSIFGRSSFVNEIVWCYSVGGRSKRRFARKHDTILWYAKSRDYSFYPAEVAVPRKPSSHMRVVTNARGEKIQQKTDRRSGKVYEYPLAQGKTPEDWWTDIETLNRSDKERCGWPTQKPIKLLERIIKCTTLPGETVADWFSGSGTTAVAAQGLDRRFLATDKQESAIVCALKRLECQGQALAKNGKAPTDIRLIVEKS